MDDWPGKVAILSTAVWNDVCKPQVVEIVRAHGMPDAAPFVVKLGEADPAGGVMMMYTLSPIEPEKLLRKVGTLSAVTLGKAAAAIREIYEIL